MIPRSYARPGYQGVRQILAPPYRNLPAEDVESLLESVGLNPDFAESFWSDVGNTLAKAAPTVLPVLGAAVGTAIGGPAGTAIGGALGNMAGQAVGAATAPRPAGAPQARPKPQARPRPHRQRPAAAPQHMAAPRPAAVPPVVATPAAPIAPAQTAPQTAPAPAPAAAQLLDLLSRPELTAALLAMTLGQAGTTEIPVGDTPVPLGAFTNLLGQLSDQAAAEYHSQVGAQHRGASPYLEGIDEQEAVLPEVRANRLLSLFAEADAQQEPYMEADPDEAMAAFYDELELAELYDEYEF